MIAANFSEFRTGLKKYLDDVEQNHETVIIKRNSGNGSVLISLDEYNSLMETVHLLSSKANADRLHDSMQEVYKGKLNKKDLDL